VTVELVGSWPRELQAAIGLMLESLDSYGEVELPPEGVINIKLVDDQEIAELNEQYSGNAYPTDVLTFAYSEDEIEDGELADIVISSETAARQATEAGIKLPDEVALLALHGILHAIGLDHHDGESRNQVETVQSEVLTRAGIPYREFTWKQ
jgi:probable rRNA maturation factor